VVSLQILKPAFTILLDRDKKSILLLIRGTHSIRDTLTAATGAVVPFHHTIVQEGGVSDLGAVWHSSLQLRLLHCATLYQHCSVEPLKLQIVASPAPPLSSLFFFSESEMAPCYSAKQ